MNPANLMGFINEHLRKRDVEIGKIEIMNTFSFFEVDNTYADKLEKDAQGADHLGKKVALQRATSTGPGSGASAYSGRSSGGNKDKFKDRFSKGRDAGSRHGELNRQVAQWKPWSQHSQKTFLETTNSYSRNHHSYPTTAHFNIHWANLNLHNLE